MSQHRPIRRVGDIKAIIRPGRGRRFPYAACNLGVVVAAHRMAMAHAKQRSTFGAPLSQRQSIRWMLADAEVEIRAAADTWVGRAARP